MPLSLYLLAVLASDYISWFFSRSINTLSCSCEHNIYACLLQFILLTKWLAGIHIPNIIQKSLGVFQAAIQADEWIESVINIFTVQE